MVWSQHDFERELKRQLIEIESIRKRVPQRDEIMERLDRLEESHLCLIRKLSEYFQRADDPAGSESTNFARDGEEIASELERQSSSIDEGLLAEFHVLSDQHSRLARRCVLDGPPSSVEDGTQGEEPSPQVVLVAEAVLNVPDLNERCASCGKVLISSLLAGESIAQQGSEWHHQEGRIHGVVQERLVLQHPAEGHIARQACVPGQRHATSCAQLVEPVVGRDRLAPRAGREGRHGLPARN